MSERRPVIRDEPPGVHVTPKKSVPVSGDDDENVHGCKFFSGPSLDHAARVNRVRLLTLRGPNHTKQLSSLGC